MSLIYETVKKEKARIEFMLNEYNLKLQTLPKGTITKKIAGNNIYYYLKYRDGKKVISKYITDAERQELEPKIAERRHIETMVKSLKEELKFADKALGEK